MMRWSSLIVAALLLAPAGWADDSPKAVAARKALEERLRALEEEERSLSTWAEALGTGEPVKTSDLFSAFVPPAVYLVDVSEPLDSLQITGTAAEIATGMLEDKDDEIQQLLAIKARLENGEDLNLAELTDLGPGMSGRTKILEGVETELDSLKAELEELRFQEKFRLAARLKQAAKEDENALLDDSPVVEKSDEPRIDIPSIEDMRQAAEAAVSAEGGMAVNLMKLAETYYKTGRYDKAWEVYERIDKAAHPHGDRILYMIGRCRERLQDLEGAKTAYEEVGRVYPDTFWSEQAAFALSVLDWKIKLGPIEGVPDEVKRVLDGNKATAKQEQ